MSLKDNGKESMQRRLARRREALSALFKAKHNGREPQDEYERYLLDVLVRLRTVYDDNHYEIQACLRANDKGERFNSLIQREQHLNTLGHQIRSALRIRLNDGQMTEGWKGKRGNNI